MVMPVVEPSDSEMAALLPEPVLRMPDVLAARRRTAVRAVPRAVGVRASRSMRPRTYVPVVFIAPAAWTMPGVPAAPVTVHCVVPGVYCHSART